MKSKTLIPTQSMRALRHKKTEKADKDLRTNIEIDFDGLKSE